MRQQLNSGFECRVFLANDLIEFRRAHSRLLQLFERTACFDPVMLVCVANQKNAVLRPKPCEETRMWRVLARLYSSTK